jgi:Mn2+/Fe2+ NRAMP family transporter
VKKILGKIGPGLLVAAAGIGAGDMIISIQTGLEFRWIYPFVVILTCILKYVITEGIARHEMASGKSIIERWNLIMPVWIRFLFLIFFIIWSYMVGAALISTTGLAASAVYSNFSEKWWSVFSSMLAFVLVFAGKHDFIEKITTTLILLMFSILIPAAVYYLFTGNVKPFITYEYQPLTLVMSMLGGVGGSVTMLSYSYWVREKNRNGEEGIIKSRTDLRFSYTITALFILSLMLITFQMNKSGEQLTGTDLIFGLAAAFEQFYGTAGNFLLKICFWGVAFSSLIAVWSGVPYLFEDFFNGLTHSSISKTPSTTSRPYRLFLGFLTVAPLTTALLENVFNTVINYTLISSFFVLGISITLLFINSKKEWMGKWTNTGSVKTVLMLCLIIFGSLLIWQFSR